jgi:DNA-binding NarL/FixJ family response regulator
MNNYGPTLKQELTPRQYELCGLLFLGWTIRDIGQFLGRSNVAIWRAFRKIHERAGTADKLELATRFAWERMDGR